MSGLKLGLVSFSQEAVDNFSEDEFKRSYKGKIAVDLNEAWEKIKAAKTPLCEEVKSESFQSKLDKKLKKKDQPL
jgi:hypothetical protein